MADINRIKVVLVEKKKTNKWLAEQLSKDPATVSKWCTNTSQPDLNTLIKIARLLEIDIRELINSSKNYNPQIEMFARFKMKSSFHKTKRII